MDKAEVAKWLRAFGGGASGEPAANRVDADFNESYKRISKDVNKRVRRLVGFTALVTVALGAIVFGMVIGILKLLG